MKHLKKIIIFFVVTVVLLEIGSFLALPAIQKNTYNVKNEFFHHSAEDLQKESLKEPHPYFGYLGTDSENFESSANFELQKLPEVFRIGIFGGSVAEMMFHYLKKNPESLEPLKSHLEIRSKKIELFNFSLSGYRQPQSFNIASLYAQGLNLTINIEGHNELAYSFDGNFPLYYPLHIMTHVYFSSPEAYPLIERGLSLIKMRKRLEQQIESWNWPLTGKLILSFRLNQILQKLKEANELVVAFRRPFYKRGEETFQKRLAFWLKTSCLQQNLEADMRTQAWFVSQPVPFVDGLKPLSQEEKVLVKNSREKMEYADGYRESLNVLSRAQVKNSGLNFIDASDTFSQNSQTLFRDSCCHLNDQGQKLFAEKIMKEIVENSNFSFENNRCNLRSLLESLNNAKSH